MEDAMMTRDAVQTWDLDFGDPPRLEFRAEGGAVVLRAAAPGEPHRLELAGRHAHGMDVRVRSAGSCVYVDADSEDDPTGEGAAFTFVVPAELQAIVRTSFGTVTAEGLGPCDLDIRSDLGAVRVNDACGQLRLRSDVGEIDVSRMAHGELEAQTSTGAVRVLDVDGRIRLSADTGEITGRGVAGGVSARTEHGQVSLDIIRLDHGEHEARSEWGGVEVALPRDAEVRLDVKVSRGSARVDFTSRPDAPAVLHASTDKGSIWIREGMARGAHRPSHSSHAAPSPSPSPSPSPTPTAEREWLRRQIESADDARPFDYDAELARILTLVAAGEISARDANELIESLQRQ
jgi:hypothetical protein